MAESAPSVTAAVIAQNEERNIRDCLAGLTWSDEILVVDGGSTDTTVSLATSAGARVVQRPFDAFAKQRNFALQEARSAWVFFVDADERVDASLAAEVRKLIRDDAGNGDKPAGYWVPRRNIILGSWVRHAGWWPDYQMRLLLRSAAHYDESRDPHELVDVEGSSGHLEHPLLHLNYTSVGQVFAKQSAYAIREARTLRQAGVRTLPHRYLTQPAREFVRRYITLEGFKDGRIGLFLALAMAWYRFQVYWALRRMP